MKSVSVKNFILDRHLENNYLSDFYIKPTVDNLDRLMHRIKDVGGFGYIDNIPLLLAYDFLRQRGYFGREDISSLDMLQEIGKRLNYYNDRFLNKENMKNLLSYFDNKSFINSMMIDYYQYEMDLEEFKSIPGNESRVFAIKSDNWYMDWGYKDCFRWDVSKYDYLNKYEDYDYYNYGTIRVESPSFGKSKDMVFRNDSDPDRYTISDMTLQKYLEDIKPLGIKYDFVNKVDLGLADISVVEPVIEVVNRNIETGITHLFNESPSDFLYPVDELYGNELNTTTPQAWFNCESIVFTRE